MGLFSTLLVVGATAAVNRKARKRAEEQAQAQAQASAYTSPPPSFATSPADVFWTNFKEGWESGSALGERIRSTTAMGPPSAAPQDYRNMSYYNARAEAQVRAAMEARAERMNPDPIWQSSGETHSYPFTTHNTSYYNTLAEAQVRAAMEAQAARMNSNHMGQPSVESYNYAFTARNMSYYSTLAEAQVRAAMDAHAERMAQEAEAAAAAAAANEMAQAELQRKMADFQAEMKRQADARERAKRQADAEERAKRESAERAKKATEERERKEAEERRKKQATQQAEQDRLRGEAKAKGDATRKRARYAAYEKAWDSFNAPVAAGEHLRSTRDLIPWPTQSGKLPTVLDEAEIRLFFIGSHQIACNSCCACTPRQKYRKEMVRWHPDRVIQRVKQRGKEVDDQTARLITMISQVLNGLCEG